MFIPCNTGRTPAPAKLSVLPATRAESSEGIMSAEAASNTGMMAVISQSGQTDRTLLWLSLAAGLYLQHLDSPC
jgi:hypothetical protein